MAKFIVPVMVISAVAAGAGYMAEGIKTVSQFFAPVRK